MKGIRLTVKVLGLVATEVELPLKIGGGGGYLDRDRSRERGPPDCRRRKRDGLAIIFQERRVHCPGKSGG